MCFDIWALKKIAVAAGPLFAVTTRPARYHVTHTRRALAAYIVLQMCCTELIATRCNR